MQQAAADEHRDEIIRQREIYENFLSREFAFNAQLLSSLQLIEDVHGRLDRAERLIDEQKILEGLRALEGRTCDSAPTFHTDRIDIWNAMTDSPVDNSTRAMKLLEQRSYELKATARNHVDNLWNKLIAVDADEKTLKINQSLDSEYSEKVPV